MKWNNIYVLENEAKQAVMIRVLEAVRAPVDDVPPIHYHNRDPILPLDGTEAVDMPNLLSRLQTLTN